MNPRVTNSLPLVTSGDTSSEPSSDWRAQLAGAVRDVEGLLDRGLVTPAEAEVLRPVVSRYELLVSDYYLGLIDRSDPNCPIRRQAIPSVDELDHRPGEATDPIGDDAHAVSPIMVHRYPDRVLLFPTFRCPMFCRYCFRKDALNARPIKLRAHFEDALGYLRAHPEVREVILSGGDPLMLSDTRLDDVLGQLSSIPSIRRLRIHTRFPVTLPQRVDASLVAMLKRHRPLFLVTHFNHPRELTDVARVGLERLVDAGVVVLNQAVLMAGVNADVEVLETLFAELLEARVRPYYLHHPDLTAGTQRFRVSLADGLRLTRALRGRLSGLAQPTYVIDIPGGHGKVAVDSDAVRPTDDPARWRLRSPITGTVVDYHDLGVRPAPSKNAITAAQ